MHDHLLTLLVAAAVAAAPEPRMQVSLTPAKARVARAEDLVLDVVVTNTGEVPARLPLLYLQIPAITLEVVDATGRAVPKGPPPVPPRDDGETGRKVLAPGESLALRFTGGTLFGVAPPPGRYRLRYRFEARSGGRDWEGVLASEWVEVEVLE